MAVGLISRVTIAVIVRTVWAIVVGQLSGQDCDSNNCAISYSPLHFRGHAILFFALFNLPGATCPPDTFTIGCSAVL